MSTLFDGLGYLMVFRLSIPVCCRASGNRSWEDVGKGILLQREHHGLNFMDPRHAPRDSRPWTGDEPVPAAGDR